LSWVVNAYTLTFAGFLLLGGRVVDLLGRRRVFLAGTGLFAFASLESAAACCAQYDNLTGRSRDDSRRFRGQLCGGLATSDEA
jgi:MFS family permease